MFGILRRFKYLLEYPCPKLEKNNVFAPLQLNEQICSFALDQ